MSAARAGRIRACVRVGVPLLALILLAACTYRVRESNIVIARIAPPADTAALGQAFPDARFEQVPITMPDGTVLHSVRMRRDDAVATLLYFGGNGYTVAKSAPAALRGYAGVPVNVVLVDHRGYGGSGGVATLDALLTDAVVVYDGLRADAVFGGQPLIVHGHSLGSFLAGEVARQRRLDGLILESSVTTTEDWMAHLRSKQNAWIRLLVRRVAPDEALAGKGNGAVVAGLDEPVLFVAGADDDVTPPRFSQALFDATPLPASRKRVLVVPSRGHMNATDSPEYREAVSLFVATLVDGRAPGPSGAGVGGGSRATLRAAESARQSRHPSRDAEESPGSTGHGAR